MLTKRNTNLVNILIIIYFTIAFVQAIAELVTYKPVMFFSRITMPVLLIILYKASSRKPNYWFAIILALFLFTNVLFFYDDLKFIITAKMILILQRLLMLFVTLKLSAEKKYLHILLAAIPFVMIFLYLNSISNGIAGMDFNTILIQSILVSCIGGTSLAAYLKNDNRQNSWLLISTLLLIGLQFVAFIERYYSSIISLSVFSPIGVALNTFGFFAFYKFVIAAEKREIYVESQERND